MLWPSWRKCKECDRKQVTRGHNIVADGCIKFAYLDKDESKEWGINVWMKWMMNKFIESLILTPWYNVSNCLLWRLSPFILFMTFLSQVFAFSVFTVLLMLLCHELCFYPLTALQFGRLWLQLPHTFLWKVFTNLSLTWLTYSHGFITRRSGLSHGKGSGI